MTPSIPIDGLPHFERVHVLDLQEALVSSPEAGPVHSAMMDPQVQPFAFECEAPNVPRSFGDAVLEHYEAWANYAFPWKYRGVVYTLQWDGPPRVRGVSGTRVGVTARLRNVNSGPPAPASPGNHPPELDNPGPQNAVSGVTGFVNLTARDEDPGDILTFSKVAGPTWVTVDPQTGRTTWVPPSTAHQTSPYDITVKVRDLAQAEDVETFRLSVTPAGVIHNIGHNSAWFRSWTSGMAFLDLMYQAQPWWLQADGSDWSQNKRPTDADADGFPGSMPAVGWWASTVFVLQDDFPSGRYVATYDGVGTLEFGWDAVVQSSVPGIVVLTVTPTGAGIWIRLVATQSGNRLRNLHITPMPSGTNRPPRLTDPGPQFIDEGFAGELQLIAVDDDPGDILTYSQTGMPVWAALNPLTGLFTWSAPIGSRGLQFSILATVRDLMLASDSKRFALTVRGGSTPHNLGLNSAWFRSWTSGIAFLDLAYQAQPWWWQLDANDWSQNKRPPAVDADGYPTAMPAGGGWWASTVFVLQDDFPSGVYTAWYDGIGTLEFGWDAVVTATVPGRVTLNVTPSGQGIWIRIVATTTGNHLRNLRITPGTTDPLETPIDPV